MYFALLFLGLNLVYVSFQVSLNYFLKWDPIPPGQTQEAEKARQLKLKARRLLLFDEMASGNNYIYLIIWYLLIDDGLFETSFEYFVYIIAFQVASLAMAS